MAADNKAEDEEQEEGGNKDLLALQKTIKTTRTIFVSLLVMVAVVISILITSVVVINIQLATRREVPSQEFAEKLTALESHLEHLIEIHNSEARVYFKFQDSLNAVKEKYTHEQINELRRQLTDRERDQRKLLALMEESASNLAEMIPGERGWTVEYSKKIAEALKASEEREKTLKTTMATIVDTADQQDGKDNRKKKGKK